MPNRCQKPLLPPGALADLYQVLHRLYRDATEPSSRRIAKKAGQIGKSISHATVCNVLSRPDKPAWRTWSNVEPIILALEGDLESVRFLWSEARDAEDSNATASTAGIPQTQMLIDTARRLPPQVSRAVPQKLRQMVRSAEQHAALDVSVTMIWEHPDLPVLREWLVQVGDEVRSGADIAVLETDLAGRFYLEAPCSGTVIAIMARTGSEIDRSKALATIRQQEPTNTP